MRSGLLVLSIIVFGIFGCRMDHPTKPAPPQGGVLLWTSERGGWDVLEIVTSGNGHRPDLHWTSDALSSEASVPYGVGTDFSGHGVQPVQRLPLGAYQEIWIMADLTYETEGSGRLSFQSFLGTGVGRFEEQWGADGFEVKNPRGRKTISYVNKIAVTGDIIAHAARPRLNVITSVACGQNPECSGKARLTVKHLRIWGVP